MKKSLLLVSLVFGLMANASAQNLPNRQITSLGSAPLTGQPSQALVSAGNTNQAKTAKEALEHNNIAMNRVIEGLKSVGLDPKDISSAQISLRPVLEYNAKSVPRVVAYEAVHMLSLRFRDIAKLGEGLDKIVQSGANNIGEVQLIVPEAIEKRDAARVSAIKEARRKAELLVTTAGGKLGRLISVQENQHAQNIRPMVRASAKMAADSAMPIAGGEQSEEVSVVVTWEIID